MSHNVEIYAHNGAKNLDQQRCNKCILCTTCIDKNQSQMIIDKLSLSLIEQFEFLSARTIRSPLIKEIKSLNWLSPVDPTDNIKALICIEHQNYYNSIEMTKYEKLSKNDRINLDRSFDALTGISVACVDPFQDIDSLTLYVSLLLPKNDRLKEITDCDIITYLRSNLFKQISYDPNRHQIIYVPLKIIKNPQTNNVKFYECPLFLCAEYLFKFSIDVKFTNRLRLPIGERIVGLHYLTFSTHLRSKLMKDYTLLSDFI